MCPSIDIGDEAMYSKTFAMINHKLVAGLPLAKNLSSLRSKIPNVRATPIPLGTSYETKHQESIDPLLGIQTPQLLIRLIHEIALPPRLAI